MAVKCSESEEKNASAQNAEGRRRSDGPFGEWIKDMEDGKMEITREEATDIVHHQAEKQDVQCGTYHNLGHCDGSECLSWDKKKMRCGIATDIEFAPEYHRRIADIKIADVNCQIYNACPLCSETSVDVGPGWVLQSLGEDMCHECADKYAPHLAEVLGILYKIAHGECDRHKELNKMLRLLGVMK